MLLAIITVKNYKTKKHQPKASASNIDVSCLRDVSTPQRFAAVRKVVLHLLLQEQILEVRPYNAVKNKRPHDDLILLVEPEGIEPSSKHLFLLKRIRRKYTKKPHIPM